VWSIPHRYVISVKRGRPGGISERPLLTLRPSGINRDLWYVLFAGERLQPRADEHVPTADGVTAQHDARVAHAQGDA
jgi:hypothetical protein